MENRNRDIVVTGLVLFAVILFTDFYFFNDLYFSGIVLIIFAAIGMSIGINRDAASLPEIGVTLRDDAKSVVVINRGNDTAFRIHVALVPLNLEFDIPSLAADARFEYALPAMLTEAKAVVTFKDAEGMGLSRTIVLSALGKSDDDLLKPMFPIFRWQ